MRRKYTVQLDAYIHGDDSDFLEHVVAGNVRDAVRKAEKQLAKRYELSLDEIETANMEVMEVFRGHLRGLWDRSGNEPGVGR